MIISPAKELNWLYFDLDCYFASVEQQDKPEFAGMPLAVIPMQHESATIIAASREAKKFGINTGTKMFEAKKKCPDIRFTLSDHKLYNHYHHLVFNEIRKHIYIDHIYSIDEGACRLTGNQKSDIESIMDLAEKIKQGLERNIGRYVTCSIGIASNKFLAKIASNIQKPDGATIIKIDEIKSILTTLELRDLPGIGRSTRERLAKSNINSVENLYNLSSDHLHKIWGNIYGKRMWYLLRGVDLPAIDKQSTTISQSKVLAPQEYEITAARLICQKLILKASKRLRDRNFYTSRVSLRIRDIRGISLKDSSNVAEINDSHNIKKFIMQIWDDLVKKHKVTKVKKIAIELSNLAEKSKQLSLFDMKENQKQERISQAIDHINKMYDSNMVTLGYKE